MGFTLTTRNFGSERSNPAFERDSPEAGDPLNFTLARHEHESNKLGG